MAKRPWIWIVASLLVLSACSDDSSSGKSVPDDPAVVDPEPETPDKPVDKPKADKGEKCSQNADCKDKLVCHEGVCKTEDEITPVMSKCESDESCSDGEKCDNGECRKVVHTGDACDSSSYCEDGVCENLVCRHYGQSGEECDNEAYLCDTGLACSESGVCHVPLGLGQACDDEEAICDSELVCSDDGVCIRIVEYGDECGDEIYSVCDEETNLVCYDGKCRKVSNDEACDENTICPEGQVCFENGCIDKKECTGDGQCGADSYCCLMDACEVKNVCVAYGTGPRKNTNDECRYQTVPGLFEADIQCEWLDPVRADDPQPKAFNIVTPVLVAKTPHNTGNANSLIISTYSASTPAVKAPGGSSALDKGQTYGVIRILNGETCEDLEAIYDKKNYVNGGSTIAIADVDGDGIIEIFASRAMYQDNNVAENVGGIVSFKWDDTDKKYKTWWVNKSLKQKNAGWGGLSVHDLNNDNVPEVINQTGEVLDAKTGQKLNGTQSIQNTYFATIADVDNDTIPEYLGSDGTVYEWSITKDGEGKITKQEWVVDYPKPAETGYWLKAFADFGTPGATPGEFDWEHKDGIAEIVSTRGNQSKDGKVAIHALVKTKDAEGKEVKSVQRILSIEGMFGGGPATIGDFDGDDLPEVGVAFGDYYAVIDPRCKKNNAGELPKECVAENFLWKTTNSDSSSYCTGSSIFDFDADGQTEVVYADECYTRILNGKNGDVLFSSKHSSRTVYEYPVVVDVDNDDSAEIIMGENTTDYSWCQGVDPVHRGIRCEVNDDCTSGLCENNFCRCESDDDCNWRKDSSDNIIVEYQCSDPGEADKAVNPKKVCHSYRPAGQRSLRGVKVLRDRYDRWASSRNIWNQFAYSITNVNDDMSIPNFSQWPMNFSHIDPNTNKLLNNFRANSQGALGMNVAPDITGKLDKKDLCVVSGKDNTITLKGTVCNRGTKTVGSKMPASFYRVDDETGEKVEKFCTSYTSENVPVGGCLDVSCSLSGKNLDNTTIRMIVNDDGEGGRTTVECNSDNNTDEVKLDTCEVS